MKVAVSATPVPVRSGVHNEAHRATPLDSEYKAKRNERATKVIQEYFKYNLSLEHKCKKENCKSGFNHCCSMCKLIRGIMRNSVLKATVGERIDEFAVGVLFGGCALKPPINEETNMTALEKLIKKHKEHPPLKQDVDDFDIFEEPIPHDSCPDNMYQSSITRQALWEVRHEFPDIVPEQLTTALLEKIKDMLAREDNMLIKENLYIPRGDGLLNISFLGIESGAATLEGFEGKTVLVPGCPTEVRARQANALGRARRKVGKSGSCVRLRYGDGMGDGRPSSLVLLKNIKDPAARRATAAGGHWMR